MKNKLILIIGFFTSVVIIAVACKKESPTVIAPPDYSFKEEFDTVANSIQRGWVIANNSKPIGTASWKQGVFYYENKKGTFDGFGALNASYSGTDFIMTTFDCGYGTANCSNWLISPVITVKNGDIISFYTRTYENPASFADRLQVRMNAVNSSADVGLDSNSVGNFTRILEDINPNLDLSGPDSYPAVWTKYSITVANVPVLKKTRVAFRYYVPNSGSTGTNGFGIGIDKFELESK